MLLRHWKRSRCQGGYLVGMCDHHVTCKTQVMYVITSIFDGVRVRHNFSRCEPKLQRGCSFQRRWAILSFPHLLEARQHVHPDPANWTWVDRAQWIEPVQGSPWQVFAHKWRNSEVLVQEDPTESTLDNLALPGSEDDTIVL